MKKVKVKVNKEKCIGCGTCIALAPDIFEMGNDGKAQVREEYKDVFIDDSDLIEIANVAMQSCPDRAIEIKEDE